MIKKETYCPLVDNGLYINTNRHSFQHCCIQFCNIEFDKGDSILDQFENNVELKKIKQDLKNGIKNSACKVCWDKEARGQISKRKSILPYNLETVKSGIEHLDLRLSNKCNLQCKMCSSESSDQWQKLGTELHNKGVPNWYYRSNIRESVNEKSINEILQISTIKSISLAGGEPMLMPEVEELIYKLVEQNKTNVHLRITTNCTSAKSDIISKLEKFNRVTILASLDGIEETLEYQRYPAQWTSIERNFKKFVNSKIKNVILSPCLTMLNLLNVHEFLVWTEQFPRVQVAYNEVYRPSFISYKLVPLKVRKDLIENLENYKLKWNARQWNSFLKTGMYDFRMPTDRERKWLKDTSLQVWDYKCKIKFLDAYPWAEELF